MDSEFQGAYIPAIRHRQRSGGMRPIMLIIGILLLYLAALMLIPAAADLYQNHEDWLDFAVSCMVTGFFGGALVMANRSSEPAELDMRQAILLTGIIWLVMPFFGSLPFLGIGLDLADAYFETASGVTTTGSTVLSGLDHMPYGQLLWRSLLQGFGGLGFIVIAIQVLPFIRSGAMQLFQSESSERGEHLLKLNAGAMVTEITRVYLVLIFLCTTLYWLFGMSPFDAFNHALTTVSTGGYSTSDASFGQFKSPALEWICIVFMMLGSLPFLAYVTGFREGFRNFWRYSQIRVFLLLLLAVSLPLALWLTVKQGISFIDTFRIALFNVTSVVTTTGYATTDYTLWGPSAIGLFLTLTFVGGCSGSTAGGIKIFRIQILFMEVRRYLLRMASPHRVIELTYDGRAMGSEVPAAVMAFIAVFMAVMAGFTMALAMTGLDIVTALTGAATALCNVGPGLGNIIGPAGNFSSLPESAKLILAVAMLAGRLELFTLLVLVSPGFWSR